MNKKPNVVVIYVDDLGYGDLSCYGAEEVKTPNVDSLVDEGIQFMNGYSTSAVCTPARYSLLTGEYPFRNPDAEVLPGDADCIIAKDQNTLPKVFSQAGYKTGIVGKWHLGIGSGKINWNEELVHTPNDIGFDYSYIFPATNDRVPCVYVENNFVVNADPNDPIEVSYELENPFEGIKTGVENPELLKMDYTHRHNDSIVNGVGRLGFMRGGEKALWKDEEMTEVFLNKAKDFIDKNKEEPFLLLYTMHQPHVPRLPNEKFKGATKLGPRGDVIVEMDWAVGQLKEYLESLDLLEDTIIIFSSDNGPVLDDGYEDKALRLNGAHKPAGPLRGGKYSKYEGGARIPLILSWKSELNYQVSDALVSQVDLMASFASMLGVDLEKEDALDSENMLDAFLGKDKIGRKDLMFENVDKAKSLRAGKWTYLYPSEGRRVELQTGIELGHSLDHKLYNMDYDVGQRENLAQHYPEIVEKMNKRIREITGK